MKSKAYVWAYILSAFWLLALLLYIPHSAMYLSISKLPWAFLIVNLVTHTPILLSLLLADWYTKKQKKQNENS
ncbi:hypothetical protein [Paenibacillus radicis (ex Gao et al. 2016)]|uniref:Uncharacterized protein n=1 Tax=Paenibacillus radicis (ex Gao et al. 2016) TaxID=1737354 RepID=A0A917HH88_9BACL|nr:hypothetical protein [Paenibacillus radicis (ex Gao et al. 2016)]GGG79491.1 hypothetical protein GCM10010918_40700 [Paenibacillus radicis (ex Gao et al. 2016)]